MKGAIVDTCGGCHALYALFCMHGSAECSNDDLAVRRNGWVLCDTGLYGIAWGHQQGFYYFLVEKKLIPWSASEHYIAWSA